MISDENTMISWQGWFEAAGVAPVMPQQGASFTDPILCLESVIAGQGIMLAWQFLAADALADGRLVAPFGVTASSGLGHYLVTARRQAGQPQGRLLPQMGERRSEDLDGEYAAGKRPTHRLTMVFIPARSEL